jgi:S-adenosylmethionine-dependent methyltransferase
VQLRGVPVGETVAVAWEQEAATWAEYNAAVYGRLRLDLIQRLLSEEHILRGQRVLDVGCGTGETALFLGAQGARITALDHSPAMLARGEREAERVGIAWTSIQMDAAKLNELETRDFDLIICHNVVPYVADGETLVGAMAERLAVGGRLSLVAQNRLAEPLRWALREQDLDQAIRSVRDRPRTRQGRTFDHLMRLQDRRELEDWLTTAGLRVDDVRGINVIAPYLDNDFKEEHYQELLELEATLGRDPTYAEISVHLHLWASRADA